MCHAGDLVSLLNDILARRLVRLAQFGGAGLPDGEEHWSWPSPLTDVAAFVEGETDDALLADLLWGLSLVDWPQVCSADFQSAVSPTSSRQSDSAPERCSPSSLFALLRLTFPRPRERGDGFPGVPPVPAIHRWAAQG
jgi:CRISPR-associated protein Csx17